MPTVYELKNVKICHWASEETYCYEASLYENGKRIGRVSNEGHGGEDIIDIDPDTARRVADTIREWNVQRDREFCEKYGRTFDAEASRKFSRLDSLTGHLIGLHDTAKQIKSLRSKAAKQWGMNVGDVAVYEKGTQLVARPVDAVPDDDEVLMEAVTSVVIDDAPDVCGSCGDITADGQHETHGAHSEYTCRKCGRADDLHIQDGIAECHPCMLDADLARHFAGKDYPLTECCGATVTGTDDGIACRSCYQIVPMIA